MHPRPRLAPAYRDVLRAHPDRQRPGVPPEVLNPRNTWSDKAAYDQKALELRDLFRKNFESKGFAALGIEAVM